MATTPDSIVLKKMNSANVRLDNSGGSGRTYEVSSNADVSGGEVTSFNGEVNKGGMQLANFSCYGSSDDNLSINYQSVAASEQCAVLTAVQEFLAASRAFVGNTPSLTNL